MSKQIAYESKEDRLRKNLMRQICCLTEHNQAIPELRLEFCNWFMNYKVSFPVPTSTMLGYARQVWTEFIAQNKEPS